MSAKSPTNSKLYYYAVRHCDALKSPAIFTCFEDCQLYVDPDENDGNVVDYKSFETIPEAVGYILKSPVLQAALRAAATRKPLPAIAATIKEEKATNKASRNDNIDSEGKKEEPIRPTKKLKTMISKSKQATSPLQSSLLDTSLSRSSRQRALCCSSHCSS